MNLQDFHLLNWFPKLKELWDDFLIKKWILNATELYLVSTSYTSATLNSAFPPHGTRELQLCSGFIVGTTTQLMLIYFSLVIASAQD